MYIIIKKSTPCFGLKTIPDRYITSTNIVRDGEFLPFMTEDIKAAQKFKSQNDANNRIEEILGFQLFNTYPKYEIVQI